MEFKKKNRKVDFAKLYQVYDKDNRSLKTSTVILAIIATFSLIFLIYYSINLFQENNNVKSQIKNIESYIFDEENIKKMNEVYEKDDQISQLQLVSDDLDSVNKIVDLYPNYGSELIEKLNLESVEIINTQYNVSNIVLSLTTTDINKVTEYVNYLISLDIFYEVKYSGFSNIGDTTNNEYSFTVECVLKREAK